MQLCSILHVLHQTSHIAARTRRFFFACCEEKSSPLFTGGGVDVHALGTGQALGLSLQAVGG